MPSAEPWLEGLDDDWDSPQVRASSPFLPDGTDGVGAISPTPPPRPYRDTSVAGNRPFQGFSQPSFMANGMDDCHGTMQVRSRSEEVANNTPEWKRRIIKGERSLGEPSDLFGPMGLETVFKPPTFSESQFHAHLSVLNPADATANRSRSISSRGPHSGRAAGGTRRSEKSLQSQRSQRSQRSHDAMRGDSTTWMEEMSEVVVGGDGIPFTPRKNLPGGIEPLREHLSSLSLEFNSKLNSSCRSKAARDNEDAFILLPKRSRSQLTRSQTVQEDTFNSSDRHPPGDENEVEAGNLTSISLPEGLSMGTQDFISVGDFVTTHRGGYSKENSFLRRALSTSSLPSPHAQVLASRGDQISPLPCTPPSIRLHTPHVYCDGSQEDTGRPRPSSSGSPLKIFGTHDTFTSNKLLRRISQFEAANTSSIEGSSRPEVDYDKPAEQRRLQLSSKTNVLLPNQPSNPALVNKQVHNILHTLDSSWDKENNDKPQHERHLSPLSKTEAKRSLKRSSKLSISKRRRTLQILPGQDQVCDGSILNSTGIFSNPALVEGNIEQQPRAISISRPVAPTPTNNSFIIPSQDIFMVDGKSTFTGRDRQDSSSYPVSNFTFRMDHARKGSITTQEYYNQASRVMDLIRARGGPISSASLQNEIHQTIPEDNSPLYTDESSEERFSRPPSREGADLRKQREMPPHNPGILSHLKKFEEKDEFDIGMSTSVGSLRITQQNQLQDHQPSPLGVGHLDNDLSCSSENIRIRQPICLEDEQEPSQTQESIQSEKSADSLPTGYSQGSSGSSGAKGIISSDRVSHLIPENVGKMIFNKDTQCWIKSNPILDRDTLNRSQTASEDDPFKDISDLTVDELQELAAVRGLSSIRSVYQISPDLLTEPTPIRAEEPGPLRADHGSRPQTRESVQNQLSESSSVQSKYTHFTVSIPKPGTRATSWGSDELQMHQTLNKHRTALGIESEQKLPYSASLEEPTCRRRAATITFSSPLVSGIAYQGKDELCSEHTQEAQEWITDAVVQSLPADLLPQNIPLPEQDKFELSCIHEDPEGLIEVQDEEQDIELSTVQSVADIEQSVMLAPPNPELENYSFQLSPLSEFTVHQVDESTRGETSYIAQRENPRALRQLHGRLVLAAEDIVRHITDAEPYEAYWEHMRRLTLRGKRLLTLHKLDKYCPQLQGLDVGDNKLSHLKGIPSSVRSLDSPNNCFSSLTSWSHLSNLQYLDISHNRLDNLDGLSNLIHLRSLDASDNELTSIQGIFGLDGLLRLKVTNNKLTSVDFKHADLTRLSELDMSKNDISSLENVDSLLALELLNLEGNQIRTLTVQKPLRRLEVLKLSNNHLDLLDVSPFPTLKALYVDCNHLSNIGNLSDCRFLDTLSAREQIFSSQGSGSRNIRPVTFDINVGKLSSIRKLFLSSNFLSPTTLIPDKPLPSLQLLDLASCSLEALPEQFGEAFSQLKTLNLNFNALHDISSLRGIKQLNRLSLVGNRITRLRRFCKTLGVIGGVHGSLTRVDLRGNPMTVGFYPAPISGSRQQHQLQSKKKIKSVLVKRDTDEQSHDKSLPYIGGGKDIARYPSYHHNNYADYPPLDTEEENEGVDTEKEVDDPFTVPVADPFADAKYVARLDESTRLRRRVMELMIHNATSGRLTYLDGLPRSNASDNDETNDYDGGHSGPGDPHVFLYDGAVKVKKDWVWNRLEQLGVLRRRERGNETGIGLGDASK